MSEVSKKKEREFGILGDHELRRRIRKEMEEVRKQIEEERAELDRILPKKP